MKQTAEIKQSTKTRKKAVRKREEGNSFIQPALATEKIPDFAKSQWFQEFLRMYQDAITRRKAVSLHQISKKLEVSHQRIYQIIDHPYTLQCIRQTLERAGAIDSAKVYANIFNSKGNPRHARLFLEYFSPVQPKSVNAGGNILINVNVFANQNRQPEPAEYTEIEPEEDAE